MLPPPPTLDTCSPNRPAKGASGRSLGLDTRFHSCGPARAPCRADSATSTTRHHSCFCPVAHRGQRASRTRCSTSTEAHTGRCSGVETRPTDGSRTGGTQCGDATPKWGSLLGSAASLVLSLNRSGCWSVLGRKLAGTWMCVMMRTSVVVWGCVLRAQVFCRRRKSDHCVEGADANGYVCHELCGTCTSRIPHRCGLGPSFAFARALALALA